ncbi:MULTISPECIES: hypothetical protein [unclassified Nocardia]|uniref:hypothetical protein n=1 Tax=unclassified Nocardia TaxID=2637762 RepID=UPI001CE48B4B|nr:MULTISPECIES: hypothetical protein [unclassified Nocardia]
MGHSGRLVRREQGFGRSGIGVGGAAAAAISGTRLFLRQVLERASLMVEQVLGKLVGPRAARFVVRTFLPEAAQAAATNAALGAGQDFFIQAGQKSAGHRKNMDWNRIGLTAATAAVGGVTGGFVGGRLNKLGNWGIGKAEAKWGLGPNAAGKLPWQQHGDERNSHRHRRFDHARWSRAADVLCIVHRRRPRPALAGSGRLGEPDRRPGG